MTQLRVILPVARVSDARPSYLGFPLLESGATFLFVPIVRLTDVLGRFNLPTYLLGDAVNRKLLLREFGSEVRIVVQITALL